MNNTPYFKKNTNLMRPQMYPIAEEDEKTKYFKINTNSSSQFKERFKLYVKNYCETSSLHGLRYLAESGRPFYERIFWLIALLLVNVGMVITIHTQIENYLRRPILMSYNGKITPVYDVPFPAVTICSENQVPPSLINMTEFAIRKNSLNVTEKIKFHLSSLLCMDGSFKGGSYVGHNLNITSSDTEIFKETALLHTIATCKKSIQGITWIGKTDKEPCKFFQATETVHGLCHTFNMLPPEALYTKKYLNEWPLPMHVQLLYPYEFLKKKTEWTPAIGYGSDYNSDDPPWRLPGGTYVGSSLALSVDFNTDDWQEECMARGQGFLLFIHNPAEIASSLQSLSYAEVDKLTMMTINPRLVETDEQLRTWTPEQRGCYYEHERQLQYFNIYTTNNCNTECEANITLAKCKCSAYFLPYMKGAPICGPEKYACIRESLLESSSNNGHTETILSACNCLPPCTELSYEVETHSQPRNWTAVEASFGIPLNVTMENSHAIIWALHQYRKVSTISRVGMFTFTDFIANVGGLMGLFLGFSVISLFEIFYFSSIRWVSNKWMTKKQDKVQKKQHNTSTTKSNLIFVSSVHKK